MRSRKQRHVRIMGGVQAASRSQVTFQTPRTMRFFSEKLWFPDDTPPKFGVAALAFGTVLSSVIAMVIAVPVALGAALVLTELAPRRIGTVL